MLVGLLELEARERPLRADQRHAAARHDAFLGRGACRIERVPVMAKVKRDATKTQ
jgi:hypothetical protein